jgi:hypothetical protein
MPDRARLGQQLIALAGRQRPVAAPRHVNADLLAGQFLEQQRRGPRVAGQQPHHARRVMCAAARRARRRGQQVDGVVDRGQLRRVAKIGVPEDQPDVPDQAGHKVTEGIAHLWVPEPCERVIHKLKVIIRLQMTLDRKTGILHHLPNRHAPQHH